MTSRKESAAASRQALLDTATTLLETGGENAVTLRAVGVRAGLSHSAVYRHFPSKEALIEAITTAAWAGLVAQLERLTQDDERDPVAVLKEAIGSFMGVARARPEFYRAMLAYAPFGPPPRGELGARSQEALRALAARVVPGDDAGAFAGLLMASAHGVADLEVSGYLTEEKWNASGDAMIGLLIDTFSRAN